ncbi:hypothetical protein [Teichococcus coralli]|uniref:hypothetical protein n=1 Tax=Teichococcus coralli TaxID=2545983 RepID=UPI0013688601|nr:hypothetical protein [Pseudoroseomonas coralli]
MPITPPVPSRGTDKATVTRLGAAEAARQQKLLQVPGAIGRRPEPVAHAASPEPHSRIR